MTDMGLRLIVDVAIGGKHLNVVLDTGSVGLRIVASQAPPDAVRRTGPAPRYGYGNGTELSGDLAQASVQIGVHKTADIPIELVTNTICNARQPDCPAANGKKPMAFGGQFDGIMGVNVAAAEGVVNPLWHLPDGLGHAFAVHYDPAGVSSLLLGVPETAFALVRLDKGDPGSASAPSSGPPPWSPNIPVCFTSAALPRGKICGPTMFDTGTREFVIVAKDTRDGSVAAGTVIEMTVGDGAYSHSYTTGPDTDAAIAASRPRSIAGLPSFAATDIRYDLAGGTIGFRPR